MEMENKTSSLFVYKLVTLVNNLKTIALLVELTPYKNLGFFSGSFKWMFGGVVESIYDLCPSKFDFPLNGCTLAFKAKLFISGGVTAQLTIERKYEAV